MKSDYPEIFSQGWPEKYVPQKIIKDDVIITSLGLAYSKGIPVLDTTYHYPYSLIKGSVLALASCIKSGPVLANFEFKPAFIHSQWSRGYYHWITESLPRAIMIKESQPNSTILLPQSHNSFHLASLKMLGIDFKVFPAKNLRVNTAVLTSCPKHYATTHPSELNNLRQKLISQVPADTSPSTRIYLSRSKSRGRYVVNESEVIDVLREYGFTVLIPEDLSFMEQVSLFSRANFLVGIHGAGLTNMLFMNKGSRILELLPIRNGFFDLRPNTLSFRHDNCYIALSKDLGHVYSAIECRHNKGSRSRTNLADIFVDCIKLREVIERNLESWQKN